MEIKDNKIAKDFLIQISRIKDINYLVALTKLLGVEIDNEDKTARPLENVIEDLLENFMTKPRRKRKELVSLLKKANKAALEDLKNDSAAL